MSREQTDRRVISVVGARPNFMKAAPVARAFEGREGVRHMLVHTGQHYDENMSDVFFRDLGMSPPDLSLGVGSGSHAVQTAKIMTAFEEVCEEIRPDMVVVYGDVNSTVAAALVATKLHIPVAHVESGLRSGDRRMPEEVNRVVVDSICNLRFVTEESGRRNLLMEGISADSIHFVGNTMIDSLARLVRTIDDDEGEDTSDPPYLVLTLHRPSNVDDIDSFRPLIEALDEGKGDLAVRFPVHPRTEKVMRETGLYEELDARDDWHLGGPVGYREFIGLIRRSRGVVTDSGGIQEETTWLGLPCVTLRESTERPSTIELGTNRLVGIDPIDVRDAVREVAGDEGSRRGYQPPPLWDGEAAGRIVRTILRYLAHQG